MGVPGDDSSSQTPPISVLLDAKISLVGGPQQLREHLGSLLSPSVTFVPYPSGSDFLSNFDSDIAVLLVSHTLEESTVERIAKYALRRSVHTQIGIFATDPGNLIGPDAYYDESFDYPIQPTDFKPKLDHLYACAHYSASLERYFTLTVATQNYKQRVGKNDAESDRTIRQLEERIEEANRLLELFRRNLDPEDFERLHRREEIIEENVLPGERSATPDRHGLPEECPSCDLSWTESHGRRNEAGYERIASNTWRCIRCGHVLANPEGNNQWVA